MFGSGDSRGAIGSSDLSTTMIRVGGLAEGLEEEPAEFETYDNIACLKRKMMEPKYAGILCGLKLSLF